MTTRRKQNQAKVPIDRHPLHPEKKLVTRRDFLSAGVMGFAGSIMMPSALELTLFARAAKAGVVPKATPGSGLSPLLIIDCAGGAALPGNFPPMDQSGNPLPDYSTLGLGGGSGNGWQIDNRFGAAFAGQLPPPATSTMQSQIGVQLVGTTTLNTTTGLLQTAGGLPTSVQSNLQYCTLPMNTSSDSQTNTISPISLVTAAGLTGSMVSSGLGMTTAQSGGNSDWFSGNPQNKPMDIQSVDSLAAALSYGAAFQNLPSGLLDSLAKALINLNSTQAAQFNNMTLGSQFSTLAASGYNVNAGYTHGVQGIDPRLDSDCQTIFGINAGSATNSQQVVYATIALNCILGHSGPGVMTVGGCDYHDGTQTTGDTRDGQIGALMAQVVQLAAAKGSKLMTITYTDGGIYSDMGARTWRGDDNQHGHGIMGFYDPAKKPTVGQTQIGYYNSGMVVEPSLAVNNNTGMIAHTFFLNYLAFNGQTSNFQSVVQAQDPTNTLLLSNVYAGSMLNTVKALTAWQGDYS